MMRRLTIATLALAALAVAALATISSSANKVITAGNGATTAFTFSFVGVAASDIQVTYTDASGNATTLTQGSGPTQYQVSLNAAVSPALWGVGGTVTYNPSGTPIATGTTLTIARILPYTQATSLSNQASFGQLASATERALDTLAMQIQQVAEGVSRVVQAPISDSSSISLTLPPAAQRANKGLAFDSSGNVIAGTTPSSGTISSAMQPVVSAASLSAGRTAFGLGGLATRSANCGLQQDVSAAGNLDVVAVTASDATNQTVASSFCGQRRIATGPITYTLLRANTAWNGFGFWVHTLAGTGSATFTPDSHDGIEGGASGTSIAIPAGASAFITTNGSATGTWWVEVIQASVPAPGGYLTPVSGSPAILADVTSGTLYYTPDSSGFAPIFNGVTYESWPFAELSASLAAGYSASTAYDWYVTNINGAAQLVSGPAWRNTGQAITGATNASPIVITANAHGISNGDEVIIAGVQGNTAANGRWTAAGVTANTLQLTGSTGNGAYTAATGQLSSRGNGAGTAQLARQNGFWTNATSVTVRNGATTYTMAANQGTFVGATIIDAAGNTLTAHRTYGQSRRWPIWNAYNQRLISLRAGDSTANWAYTTNAFRASNGAAGNSMLVFSGLPDGAWSFSFSQTQTNAGSSNWAVGIGFASTTAAAGFAPPISQGGGAANVQLGVATYADVLFMGAVTVTSLENGKGTAGTTFNGAEPSMLLTGSWRG